MSVKDGKSSEQVERERRDEAARIERQRWAEYYRTYERCIEIAEDVWTPRLDAAQEVQQALAIDMRDRRTTRIKFDGTDLVPEEWRDNEIPVPLFTPRDRLEFIGRESGKLFIGTERRNLTVLFPKEVVTEPAPEVPAEAASGVEEGLDEEAGELTAQGLG